MSPEEVCARMRNRLVERVAERRWQLETGGMVVGGVTVATDDRTKTLVTGARIRADADPDALFDFKTAAGWVQLGSAQIIAISDALADRVQALFSAEAVHAAAIAALPDDPDALRDYDIGTGWPA